MQERHFHQELDQLKMTVLHMAAMTERALEKATRALFERDSDLAEEVIREDQEINRYECLIDQLSLKLLALGQPMARDLRFIIGCMRISVNLERAADQAVNVAERAIYLAHRPPLPPNPLLERLADQAADMLKSVISAFINENADQATEVCQMDDEADDLNLRILKNLLDYIVHETPAIKRGVQTIIIARCLERIADLATNIAEAVIFVVKGVNIKHHCAE